jgi:hypothetical protein
MTLIRSAHTGEHPPSTVHLHERSGAKLSAFAEALAKRNTELLISEVERIRSEAAEQCRLLAALSMSVASAEAARERRFAELERELSEQAGGAAPQPLPIPRSREGASVTELWPAPPK